MLDYLKKIFTKEPEPEQFQLSRSQIPEWLKAQKQQADADLQQQLRQHEQSIEDGIKNIQQKAEELDNAELQNPNIPEKAKSVLEGNRRFFVNKAQYIIKDLQPHFNDIPAAQQQATDIISLLDDFAKSTKRSYAILSEFFLNEVSAIASEFKQLEQQCAAVQSTIDASARAAIQQAETMLHLIDEQKAKLIEFNTQQQDLGNQRESLVKKQKELEQTIADLKSSEGYKEHGTLMIELAKIKQWKFKIEQIINYDFGFLERPLRKYEKIAFEGKETIQKYLRNPVKALEEDAELNILDVLKRLLSTLEEGKLGLDPKKREKSMIHIKKLTKDYLTKARADYQRTALKAETIKNQAAAIPERARIHDEEVKVQDCIQAQERLGKELEKTKKDHHQIDLGKHEHDLADALQKLHVTVIPD